MISRLPSSGVRAFAVAVFLAPFGACSLNVDVNGPSLMFKQAGDQQTAAVNTTLTAPFVVLVATQFGAPLAGETVTWSIAAGGGSLSESSTVTGQDGTASVTYTTGGTTGMAQIKAQVRGLTAITFFVTVT